jgi:hypothetical protein
VVKVDEDGWNLEEERLKNFTIEQSVPSPESEPSLANIGTVRL